MLARRPPSGATKTSMIAAAIAGVTMVAARLAWPSAGDEQPDAEGEAERDGVELEGVARAPVRPGSGDGVSHARSYGTGRAPEWYLRMSIFIIKMIAVRGSNMVSGP